jgi:hypothetical protein
MPAHKQINASTAWPRGAMQFAGRRPAPACRLHLRVRHQSRARSPIVTGARRTDARPPALVPAEPRFAALREPGRGRAHPAPATQGTDAAAASPIRDASRERPSTFGPTVVRPRRHRCWSSERDVGFPGQAQPRGRPFNDLQWPRATPHTQVVLSRMVPNDLQISCRLSARRPHE